MKSKKIKILFLIHDLGPGGAEKVLVTLANNLDKEKFSVTILSLFDVGVNRQFIQSDVEYKYWLKHMFRGNQHLFKLLSPETLHNLIIKDKYDLEIAFLEGPCCRIISGADKNQTKTIGWVHITQKSNKQIEQAFRSKTECINCYSSFDRLNFVSNDVRKAFEKHFPRLTNNSVLYNPNNTDKMLKDSQLKSKFDVDNERFNIVGVGKIIKNKGFDRLIIEVSKLIRSGNQVSLYLLGSGPELIHLKKLCSDLGIEKEVHFTGYLKNPYSLLAKMDLFACTSKAEGFSTAATEALILGIPVVTLNVGGMKELLGDENQYGIVTQDVESLGKEIAKLATDQTYYSKYKKAASDRGKQFVLPRVMEKIENQFLEVYLKP